MSDPRHRRIRRKRGLALPRGSGKRRSSGIIDEVAPSREELTAAARRRAAVIARRRMVVATVIAVALVAGAVLLADWLRSRPDDNVPQPPVTEVPDTGSSLLALVVDDSGAAVSIALVGASPDGPDRVVLFHPSLLVTLPGFGENLLSLASRFGGADLADTAITNLAGVRVDSVVIWNEAQLAAAIGQQLTIDLPVPLLVADGNAEVVVAAAGEVSRSPEEAARFMVEAGTSDQLDLLQRQGGVWRAILAAVAGDGDLADRLAAGADRPDVARTALVGVATGEPIVTLINADRIDPTGGGEERYQLDGADAAAFVATHVPYLQIAAEPRVRVEVLNGNGLIGTTGPVAAELVDEGFWVVITDNADRDDYETTRIIAHGREHQEAALAVHDVIGRGDVSIEVRQPSGVVDVTIIVGQDLPAGQR